MAGYLCKFYVKVVRVSAKGDENTPSWGEIEFTDFGDLFLALLRTVGVVIFCGALPAVYLIFLSEWTPDWIFYSLIGLSLFYYPMALLSVLYYEDILELNPIRIFDSIRRVPFLYSVVVLIFFAIVGICWSLLFVVGTFKIIIVGNFISFYIGNRFSSHVILFWYEYFSWLWGEPTNFIMDFCSLHAGDIYHNWIYFSE